MNWELGIGNWESVGRDDLIAPQSQDILSNWKSELGIGNWESVGRDDLIAPQSAANLPLIAVTRDA